MSSNIQLKIDAKHATERACEYLSKVPPKLRLELEARALPKVRRGTKNVVKQNAPVERGIYRKSFTINNYTQGKWNLGFEVYAKQPHYRLTHLLEGKDGKSYGHELWQFKKGQGKKTRWGNVGMVHVGKTRKFPHLDVGYKYAIKEMDRLCNEAVHNAFEK